MNTGKFTEKILLKGVHFMRCVIYGIATCTPDTPNKTRTQPKSLTALLKLQAQVFNI